MITTMPGGSTVVIIDSNWGYSMSLDFNILEIFTSLLVRGGRGVEGGAVGCMDRCVCSGRVKGAGQPGPWACQSAEGVAGALGMSSASLVRLPSLVSLGSLELLVGPLASSLLSSPGLEAW